MTALTTKPFPTPVYWKGRCQKCNKEHAVWCTDEYNCECGEKLKFFVHNVTSSFMTLKELRYEFGIFEVCQRIHMAVTGAAEPIHKKQMTFWQEWLYSRLDTWQKPCKVYDRLVKMLIQATLRESNERFDWATYGDNE